jgi:GDPmannose 4,6-dehydratase
MSHKKKALIFGVTGHIGQYLASRLLDQGYHVYGSSRTKKDIDSRILYTLCDFNNYTSIFELIKSILPNEIYNLVSPININDTINDPIIAYDTNISGLTHLCESIKSIVSTGITGPIKLFNASSIEVYRGHITDQNLTFTFNDMCTDFYPMSPYGISKTAAYWITRYYREAYQLPFYTGVLCNVVSPRLRDNFVLSKIIKHVKYQPDQVLRLGNIDIEKDFIHASDVVDGILMAVHCSDPTDYVISSGQSYTLRNLIEYVYKEQGISIQWDGDAGYNRDNHQLIVTSDANLKRKYEKKGEKIIGCSGLLRGMGWVPQYDINAIIHEMYLVK